MAGQGGGRLGVEEFDRNTLQLIQGHPVFRAGLQVLLQGPVLGAVVEDGCPAGLLRGQAPEGGQGSGRLLRPFDMGQALGLHHGEGDGSEVLVAQVL